MADFKFSDGTEVDFDLGMITMKEWREMRSPAFTDAHDDELIAKIADMPVEKLASLTIKEYKRLFSALIKKMTSPLADPN
jgi:hypothetical protein